MVPANSHDLCGNVAFLCKLDKQHHHSWKRCGKSTIVSCEISTSILECTSMDHLSTSVWKWWCMDHFTMTNDIRMFNYIQASNKTLTQGQHQPLHHVVNDNKGGSPVCRGLRDVGYFAIQSRGTNAWNERGRASWYSCATLRLPSCSRPDKWGLGQKICSRMPLLIHHC